MGNRWDVRATVVSLADNSTTVYDGGNALLHGIYVNTVLSAHTCPVQNAGGTAVITLPASTAAGTNVNAFGVICVGGIVVDPNDSATGSITVFWSPR